MTAIDGLQFETIGRSMWPLLRPGDVVQVEPLHGPPHPGDIVVYVDEAAKLVAHRVIEALPDGRLRLRGDFAFTAEPPVELRRIVGRLTAAHRPGRGPVRIGGLLGRLMAFGLPPLERQLPVVSDFGRRSVVACVQVADRVWTAAPVRRLRRLRSRGRHPEVFVAPLDGAVEVDRHLRRSGRDPTRSRESGRHELLICARIEHQGGRVVASARLSPARDNPTSPQWSLRDLYVEHRWRGLGIGRMMVNGALASAAERGAVELLATVPKRSDRAVRLFNSLGFAANVEVPEHPGESLLRHHLSSHRTPHIVPGR